MERVSVIGSGTMGHSIAISLAWGDHPVKVYCINNEAAEDGLKNIDAKLEVMIKHKAINLNEAEEIKNNIKLNTSLAETLSDTTFIIEAITENLELKRELFNNISEYIDEKTVLASNTSGFLPSELSYEFKYPEQFAVTHF